MIGDDAARDGSTVLDFGLMDVDRMTPLEVWACREFLGLTIDELAGMLDVQPRAVERWQAGDRPISPDRARQLADLLATSTAQVAELVERAKSSPGLTFAPPVPESRYPEGWWLQVAMRARAEVPDLRIAEPVGGTRKGRRR